MSQTPFRAYLAHLEAAGQLRRVGAAVDPRYELGAILRRVSDESGPAVLFESVGNGGVPVVANLFGTRERVGTALGISTDKLVTEWAARLDTSIPAIVEDGTWPPAGMHEVDVDLTSLPHPVLNHRDGGAFITAGVVFTVDPEGGARNAAIYRLQVHDDRALGILAAPHRDGGRAIVNAKARGEDLPVAIAIGVPPPLFIAACSPVAYGRWEADIAGAIGSSRLTLTRLPESPLAVPACEIVLLGMVRTGERRREGPFGEFTGYYGPAGDRPVIEITAMYVQDDPILHVAYIGYPITETQVLQTVTGDATAYQQLKSFIPGLVSVHLPAASGGQPIMYLSLRKRSQGEAGNAILAAMASKNRPKYVVVVDEDIDVHDDVMVQWAVATRSRPDRSVYLVPDSIGMSLDPMSTHTPGRFGTSVTTHKLGIDATIPLDREDFPEVIRPHPDYEGLVARRWLEFFPSEGS